MKIVTNLHAINLGAITQRINFMTEWAHKENTVKKMMIVMLMLGFGYCMRGECDGRKYIEASLDKLKPSLDYVESVLAESQSKRGPMITSSINHSLSRILSSVRSMNNDESLIFASDKIDNCANAMDRNRMRSIDTKNKVPIVATFSECLSMASDSIESFTSLRDR